GFRGNTGRYNSCTGHYSYQCGKTIVLQESRNTPVKPALQVLIFQQVRKRKVGIEPESSCNPVILKPVFHNDGHHTTEVRIGNRSEVAAITLVFAEHQAIVQMSRK